MAKGILPTIREIHQDFRSGQCLKNFKSMSWSEMAKTCFKVATIALLSGIFAGMLGSLANDFIGFLLGSCTVAIIGLIAFAYCTAKHNLGQQIANCAKQCARTVKQAMVG